MSFRKVLPSPQRNTSAVRVTIGFLVTSLTNSLEATVYLGTFNAAEMFWNASVPQHNPVSGVLRTIPSTSWLTCTVNCRTFYRQVCAFSNHVKSIEFTICGLKSSCRNISRMINGNRMHLSSIASLIAKGLKTYSTSQKLGHIYSFKGFSLFLKCSTL